MPSRKAMNPQKRKKMKKILKTLGLTVVVTGAVLAADRMVRDPAMHVKVVVNDEDGHPIKDAPAQVRFPMLGKAEQHKNTDSEGRAEFTFTSWPGPCVDVLVGTGYAPVQVGGASYHAFRGIGYTMNPKADALNRYEPWGPEVTLILKKVRNPVPLDCVFRHMVKFNAGVGAEMGYDFLAKDWVSPYGQGKVTDAYIRVDTLDGKVPEKRHEFIRMNNLRISVRFPNDGDGMIKFPHFMGTPVSIPYRNAGSVLWHAHEAPESGYVREVTFQSLNDEEISQGVACTKADPGLYGFMAYEDKEAFRRLLPFASFQEAAYLKIRSTNGNEKSMYAVMHYGITADWMGSYSENSTANPVPTIHMRYKLNPTLGDRNLEWNGVNLLAPQSGRDTWPKDEQ